MDVHVHLERFDLDDGPSLVRRAKDRGVIGIIGVGTTERSLDTLLRWKDRFPDFVNIAIGLHPELRHTKAALNAVLSQIRTHQRELVAIGEVGLPHYSDLWEDDESGCRDRAVAFAGAAVDTELPLIVHAVHDKASRMAEILGEAGAGRAVFHWLKAPVSDLDDIVAGGYFASVTPRVATREEDRVVAARVPSSHLLLETDAPEPHDGVPSQPCDIVRAAVAVAQIRGVPLQAAAADVLEATSSLFPDLASRHPPRRPD